MEWYHVLGPRGYGLGVSRRETPADDDVSEVGSCGGGEDKRTKRSDVKENA